METEDITEEFSALVEWLQTFNLQSETSTPSDLSAGAALSEALVNIEPSFFTPSWFAGILHTENSAKQNLNSVLNLMLHYYRQNLEEVTSSSSLQIPDLSGNVGQESLTRFLKLMLGIAVTCPNRQTFISRIGGLDQATQHSLTQSLASFIIIKDWSSVPGPEVTSDCEPEGEAGGRESAQSLTSDTSKGQRGVTPPGDEIWAQKCHELDFQVALLKQERSNLMVENEELYGKVREAQTLSRKDSVKAKQLETEVDHLKDEFDRLRALYVSTREHMDSMEKRIRPEDSRDAVEMLRLKGETAAIKTELSALKASYARRPSDKAQMMEECEVIQSLRGQQDLIQELRNMVEYQVSVQTGLSREMDCLKDQLDVMREAWHNLSDTSGRYEWEEPEPGSDAHAQSSARAQRLPSLRSEACLLKLPSLMQRSEACLAGPESSQSQSNLLEHSYTVSRTNLAKSTFEIAGRLEESSKSVPVKVAKKKSSPVASPDPGGELKAGPGASDPVYVNNYEYADFYTVHGHGPATCGSRKSEESDQDHVTGNGSHVVTSGVRGSCGVYSTESDSGLDVTPDSGTPYTGSRPESELLLDTGDREEAEVEASPRQLEIMMNRSTDRAHRDSRDVDELIRVISDSNIAISVDEIEALVGAGAGDEDYSQLVEELPHDTGTFMMESFRNRSRVRPCLPIPLDPAEIQLFDPNDPKVKDLEEWNCSVHEKSIYEEEAPKKRLRRMFSLRKKSKPEELKVLTKMNSVVRKKSGPVRTFNASEYSEKYHEDNVNLECFKTWLLSIFVKIFD